MSLLIILLITAAAVAYVGYPLLAPGGARRQSTLLTVEPDVVIVAGVSYANEEEWAVDRALDKADDGKPEREVGPSLEDVDAEIERRVAAARSKRRKEQAEGQVKRTLCPVCGKPFQAGDRFCGRCGAPHPNVCPQCGERHRPDDLHCAHCGSALSGGQR